MSQTQDISAALNALNFEKFPKILSDWPVNRKPIQSTSAQALAQAQRVEQKYKQWTQSPTPKNKNAFWKDYIKACRMIAYNEQHISNKAEQLDDLLSKIISENRQFNSKKGLPKNRKDFKPKDNNPESKKESKSENALVRFFKWLFSKLFGTKKSVKQAKKVSSTHRILTPRTRETAHVPSSNAFQNGAVKITGYGNSASYVDSRRNGNGNSSFDRRVPSFNPYSNPTKG